MTFSQTLLCFFFSKIIVLDLLFLICYNELVGVKNKRTVKGVFNFVSQSWSKIKIQIFSYTGSHIFSSWKWDIWWKLALLFQLIFFNHKDKKWKLEQAISRSRENNLK